MLCLCGDVLPHYCPYTASGPGYDQPDPGGPDLTAPHGWIVDLMGRDQ